MNYIKIPGVQRELSRLVLGGRFGEQDEALSFALFDAFLALGGNAIDTAHSYANGESERLIGRWFLERRNRERIFLIDKGCHPTSQQLKRVTPQCIRSDIHESLSRLQTSYIDLYFLHRDDRSVPVGPLLETLNEEMASGRILSFGASNWHRDRLAEATEYAKTHNIVGFCTSSCNLSLAIPKEPMWPSSISLDAESRAWYTKTQMPLFAWSSQARGWFSGAYIRGNRWDADVIRVYDSHENRARLIRAEVLAVKKGISAVQIALAYVLNQPFPVLALIGPESLDELHESAAIPELTLLKEEIEYLEGGLCN